jgi:hypothetical protein
MSHPDEIQLKQEKLIGKLGWLIDRTKLDFKGNPAPFAKLKSKRSVEKSKKDAERQMQGDTFKPWAHVKAPLALDATRSEFQRPSSSDALTLKCCEPLDPRHHCLNPYHQVLDPQTGQPEIQEIVRFAGPRPEDMTVRGRRRYPAAESAQMGAACSVSQSRPSAKDVDTATPQQRLQLLRADAIAHPKYTQNSRLLRAGEAWNRDSQLSRDAILSPPAKEKSTFQSRRNEIRMTDHFRRAHSSSVWK